MYRLHANISIVSRLSRSVIEAQRGGILSPSQNDAMVAARASWLRDCVRLQSHDLPTTGTTILRGKSHNIATRPISKDWMIFFEHLTAAEQCGNWFW